MALSSQIRNPRRWLDIFGKATKRKRTLLQ